MREGRRLPARRVTRVGAPGSRAGCPILPRRRRPPSGVASIRMTGSHLPRKSAAALVATTALALASAPGAVGAATHPHHPSPGAAGLGDRLYPTLGNGGYDAKHYDLALRYATRAPTQGIDGTM